MSHADKAVDAVMAEHADLVADFLAGNWDAYDELTRKLQQHPLYEQWLRQAKGTPAVDR